jgi:hypothetical protein
MRQPCVKRDKTCLDTKPHKEEKEKRERVVFFKINR